MTQSRTNRVGFYLSTPESLGMLELFLPLLPALLRIRPQGILTGCRAGPYNSIAEREHGSRIWSVLASGSAFMSVPSDSFEEPYGSSLAAALEAVEDDKFHRNRLPEQADGISLCNAAILCNLLCDLCSVLQCLKKLLWTICLFYTVQSSCRIGRR